MASAHDLIKQMLRDPVLFAEHAGGMRLRRYQQAVAQAVVASVLGDQGLSFVVVFPRQSGKNELQAHIESYLLTLFAAGGGEIVKVSPTLKPQSLNAMRRLERVLEANPFTRFTWRKEQGFIYRVGQAAMYFYSGSPFANVVGATASLLLECDEAQSVLIAKWDRDFAPMAASTNATRVFWGTAWTSRTLLGRELRLARLAEQADGCRRVFWLDASAVAEEVPAYQAYVAAQVARLGRQHPLVRTQYFSEELDGEAGMFPARRRALMQGDHPPRCQPEPGQVYAFLVDVGGEEVSEGVSSATGQVSGDALTLDTPAPGTSSHDATALTIVAVDLSALAAPRLPLYRVVDRRLWTGASHRLLYGQLLALAELWRPRRLVIDATGVGAGLAAFLQSSLPGVVIPFTFTAASKSKLGWDFLSVIETGRYREHAPAPAGDEAAALQALFWQQATGCELQVVPGAGRLLRWGVPEAARHPETGRPLHDDLLVSAALCARLDGEPWGTAESLIVPARDPLDGLSF